jgi:hypothetical protein
MAFLEYNLENNIAARFKNLKADNIRVFNEISGEYENVLTWSSSPEPISLPYYLKSNNIEMKDESNLAYSLLTKNTLTLSDSVLDGESINASNRVKNIAQDMSPNDKKMLLYDASTKGLTYGNQPTPTVLPTWVQPTAATFSSGTDSASLESNFFRLNSDTSRTFIDSDNLSFTKNSILNFELRRNAAESDEMQLRWMDSAGNLASKIGYDSIFGKKLFLPGVNGTIIEPGVITCGYVDPVGTLVTTTKYGKLSPGSLYLKNSSGTQETAVNFNYLAFKEDGVTNIFNKEGVRAANNLASLPLVSGSTSSYNNVIYDPTTKLYRYTPIPSGGSSASVVYQANLLGSTLPGVTFSGTTPYAPSFTVGEERACKSYNLNEKEKLVLIAAGDVKYNQWYALVLGNQASQVTTVSIISEGNQESESSVKLTFYGGPAIVNGSYTIPQYSTFFKITHSGTLPTPSTFSGRIIFEKVSNNATLLPTLAGTPI